jgi:Tol biopolymer transport system component
VIAGLVLGILAGAGTLWIARPRSSPPPLRRFELPAQGPFRSSNVGNLVAISPEGLRVAYSDQGKLFIRSLDQIEPKIVATSAEPTFLFWSPDGAWLAYAASGKIWKVAAEGGESKIVVDQPGELTGGAGGSWGPRDTIVFTRGEDAVYEVPATGGDVKTLLHADPNEGGDFHEPSWLPDGSGVLLIYHPRGQSPNSLSLLAGGVRKELLKIENQQFWYPTYSSSGHILYRRQPTNPGIWALPFSLSKHEVTGEPFLVVPDGDVESVSNDGTMAYVKGGVSRMTQLTWLDRNGKTVGTVGQPQEQWPFPALSPDGGRVAVAAAENEKRDLWIHDVERGTMTRLTFDTASIWSPAWTPRGDSVVYTEGTSPPFKIFSKAADGTGEPKPIAEGWGVAVSPDGRYLTYATADPNTSWDLWYQDLERSGAPVSLLKANRTQIWAQISPDGRYFAYQSDETGREEVYIKRFPSGEGKWQVSVDGGDWPLWNRKGTKIYYARGDDILEAAVSTSQALTLGKPQVAVTRPPLGVPLIFGWPPGFDVSADEQRFLLCLGVGGKKAPTGIVVVENWLAEFNRKK